MDAKEKLPRVTLCGLDCVDIERLVQAAEICQTGIDFGAVKLLTSLPSSNSNVVHVEPVTTIEAYSRFVVHDLNTYIDTDFVLLVQYDGFILNPAAWRDEFLEYDYIGAPWWHDGAFMVGNGGFSLRSKKLLEVLQNDPNIKPTPHDEPEDTYISRELRPYLERRGIKFSPVELAKQFSLEGNEIDGVEWSGQFGFHGLRWTDISRWLAQHPQYRIDNPLDSWALGVKKKFDEGRLGTSPTAQVG